MLLGVALTPEYDLCDYNVSLLAPRRPMSAFLFYSIGKRQQIKEDNPEMKNTEISRMLGEMWRSLSDEERRPFVEKEKTERDKYKVAIAEWRKTSRAKQEAQRKAAMEQQQTLMTSMHEQPAMYPDHYGAPAIAPMFYPGYPMYGMFWSTGCSNNGPVRHELCSYTFSSSVS